MIHRLIYKAPKSQKESGRSYERNVDSYFFILPLCVQWKHCCSTVFSLKCTVYYTNRWIICSCMQVYSKQVHKM